MGTMRHQICKARGDLLASFLELRLLAAAAKSVLAKFLPSSCGIQDPGPVASPQPSSVLVYYGHLFNYAESVRLIARARVPPTSTVYSKHTTARDLGYSLRQLSAELDDNYSDEEPFRDLLDPTARENRSRGLDSEHFEFIEYAEDGEEEDAVLIEAVVEDEATHRTFNRKWEPNPRYTSCTPMAFNITNLGEKKRLTASFLWYSDDPTFNLQRFQSLHHHLAWQTDFWDPDHEAIKMETVRLLHFQQGLELWHIDELKLPTFPKIRKNSADGLVWQSSQRDMLSWPESQMSPWPELTLPYVKKACSSTGEDIFSQVEYATSIFCPNLSCLRSYPQTCPAHSVPAIREQTATLPTTEYPRSRDCCSDQCFMYIEDEIRDDKDADLDHLLWPNGTLELETLESVLKITPDALPCDVAVLCRLPCNQVFANRRRLISDDDILDDRILGPVPTSIPAKYLDVPVVARVDERTGESILDYPELPVASRECDPDLCLGCGARSGKKCYNTTVQHGRFARIRIRRSEWGYGAFATEPIAASSCVGDYVGEVELEQGKATKILSMIRTHSHLNYAFGLYDNVTIDSRSCGNDTRYLNHSEEPNCVAAVWVVNNTYHITLQTQRHIKSK
ncbi:hypothetical protein NMY22_g4022 [Coprinellus aureogranulatus]|nr:hypothetical protein NMY22_g4022 [Coprinellus aureogranulatus]